MKPKITGCILLIVTISSILSTTLFAQRSQYAEVSISSPTAATLGKYADIPVNYHTGIPQIDVPLYTVKEGPLSLPISLKYHAGGLKVMEPAGWVGAGWSLNAGGVITRKVRGAPDESGNSNAIKGHFSDYGYSSYYTIGQPGGYPSSTGPSAPNDNYFMNNIYDGEPDLYFFNFGEYSGKFFFDDDRRPVIVDGEDLKIEYYYPRDDPNDPANTQTGISANIYGFIITVPNGDKYYFGINKGGTASGANPVEITFPYSASHQVVTDNVFSSWYLNKIVSADGMFTISLKYQAEAYSYYSLAMFPVDAEALQGPLEYELVKNNMEGVRLSQISFSNGTVDFIPESSPRLDLSGYITNGLNENTNTEAKALGTISISGRNNFCKKYAFTYSYFEDNVSNLATSLSFYNIQSDKKRLRLDKVTESSCDNALIVKPYVFDYYNNFAPRLLSFSQDHWGFYNGAVNYNTLIPTYTKDTYTFVQGANRDAKWPEMQYGTLTKITYPTGGSDNFEFEPNTTWVTATRYDEQYGSGYSVGYDGNNSAYWNNLAFSGNYYRVVMSNATCPGTSSCGASASLSANGATVLSISAAGGESVTQIVRIPAGTYNLNMYRSDVRSGTSGAQVAFYEIVPTPIQNNVIVGGLRIKNITRINGTGQSNEVTNFTYDVNNQSTGILYSRPAYVQIVRNDILAEEGWPGNTSYTNYAPHGCVAVEGTRQQYFKSPCEIIPMATTQGNHIGYNEVKVSQSNNGYSIYRYYGSNLWDINHGDVAYRNVIPLQCDFSIPNSPAAPPPFEYKRGLLKYEGHFNQSGQRIKDTQYDYTFDSTKIATPAYLVEMVLSNMLGTEYGMRGYWRKQMQTIETNCIPGGACLQETKVYYYESPYHHQATREVTTSSKGESLETKSKYALDYRLLNCDGISDGVATYNSDCAACDAAMRSTLSNTSLTRDYRFMARVDNRICKAQARKNYALLRKNNFTGLTNAFQSCLQTAKGGANVDLKPILELQTRLNNALIEKTEWRSSKLTAAEFYKYDFLGTPSTTTYLSKVQWVSAASPLTDFTASTVSSNNTAITKDSRYKDELSYQFANGNIVERRKVNDFSNVYLWGYNFRFPLARITGTDYNAAKALINQSLLDNATGQYTDAQIRTELNKLRTGLPDAQVFTYTYSPLAGITSETDASGKTIYYEYDILGRLKLIKDQDGKILKQYDYHYQAPLNQ